MAIDGGLSAIFQRNIPEPHWQRIETPLTGLGVSDMNYCVEGAEGWVEFKKTSAWAVEFQMGQTAWITRRARAGGRVHVAVRRLNVTRRGSTDELWMVRGRFALVLEQQGLARLPPEALAYFGEGGPLNWSWDRIRAVLSSPAPESPETGPAPGSARR